MNIHVSNYIDLISNKLGHDSLHPKTLMFKVLICFLEQVFQVLTVGNKMVAFCVLHGGVFICTDSLLKCRGKLNIHSVKDQSVYCVQRDC
jgi:hypothetical protein